jgi:hypothetical protein
MDGQTPQNLNEHENNPSTSGNQNNFINDTANLQNLFADSLGHTMKIPPVWIENIELWFEHLEIQFELKRITKEETKYAHLVSIMDYTLINQVSDIIYLPKSNYMYSRLKKALVERLGMSLESRRKKLFQGLELGDKKPSTLLREIKITANGLEFDEDTIKQIWMQQLPKNIVAHITVGEHSLDNMGIVADKLFEIYSSSEVCDVKTSGSSQNNSHTLQDTINDLSNKLESLTKQFQSIVCQSNQTHNFNNRNTRPQKQFIQSNSSNYNNFHNRKFNQFSNCNNFDQNRNSNEQTICYYHCKFKDNARRCIQPCNYMSNQKNL